MKGDKLCFTCNKALREENFLFCKDCDTKLTYGAKQLNTPAHYDNSNGSLYKFAEDHGLNAWEFDILKRVVRCRKKGQFLEDINKTIEVLKLYKKEYNEK